MSLVGEPPHEIHQKEVEIQQDEEPVPEGKSDDVQMKEFTPSQTEKRAISPLTLLKDDFNQLKEEIRKKFKEIETNTKTNEFTEKQVRPQTLLREDLNHLRENLASVFRIGVPKKQEHMDEAVKEDNNSRVKPSKAERTDEPFRSLFRRERPLPKSQQRAEDVKEVKKNNKGRDFRGILTRQSTEKGNATKNHENKSKNMEMNVIDSEITRISQTQHSEMFTSKTGQTMKLTDGSL